MRGRTLPLVDFFDTPQAAAVLKHGVLRRHFASFATKTGSVAGEVVYLDGYAGPGLYSDGSEGSPALALATAEVIANYKGKASLHGHLIEQKAESINTPSESCLQRIRPPGRSITGAPKITCRESSGRPSHSSPSSTRSTPIPCTMLVDIMKRGGTRAGYGRVRGTAVTEVLLNFSNSGINRFSSELTGDGTDPTWLKARATMVTKMDDVLGGEWWQPIWRTGRA